MYWSQYVGGLPCSIRWVYNELIRVTPPVLIWTVYRVSDNIISRTIEFQIFTKFNSIKTDQCQNELIFCIEKNFKTRISVNFDGHHHNSEISFLNQILWLLCKSHFLFGFKNVKVTTCHVTQNILALLFQTRNSWQPLFVENKNIFFYFSSLFKQ